MTPFEFPWWVYLTFVFSFFGVCMGLNYLVKKINEAKIEERLMRMLQKASTTQSTQVTGPLIAVETSGAGRLNNLKTMQQRSPPGISLVFNREENKRRGDPYSLVKPIIPRLSMENINSIPPSVRTINSIPMKRIGSAQVVAKANSSHILTEKVLVKTSEYGNQSIKKTSSKSDCYVTKLITVKMNEYGNVPELEPYSVDKKRTNKSKLDYEIQGKPPEKSTTSIYVQDEGAIENVRTASGSKAEETTPKDKIDVPEKVLSYEKNIYTSRIIRTKTSIVDITVEKQDVNENKTDEEINTGCSIKKSVESLISKIASNLKNKNEDPKIDKNVADCLIAAKQSSSNGGSGQKVTEINSAEKTESRIFKENSYPAEIDNVEESCFLKKIELDIDSEFIKLIASDAKSNRPEKHFESAHNVAKTSIGRVDENISNKNVESGHIDAKGGNKSDRKVESSHTAMKQQASAHSQDALVGENVQVIEVESGHTAIKQTTSAYSQDARLGEIIPVKSVESRQFENIETSSVHGFESVGDYFLVKKSSHAAMKQATAADFHYTRVGEIIPVEKVESVHTATKPTTPADSQDALVNAVKKVELGRFDTKVTTSTNSFDLVREDRPVKKLESRNSAIKQTTSAHSQDVRVNENTSIKKVESSHIAAKNPTSIHSFEGARENIPVEMVESEYTSAKPTATSAHLHNESAENNIPVKKVELGHVATKETASVHSLELEGEHIPVELEHVTAKDTVSVRTLLRGENIPTESGFIDAKEIATSHSIDDDVGENNQVKRVESDHIAVNEVILHAENSPAKKELVSVKKSVTLIESRRHDFEKPLSILRTNYNARECANMKKMDSEMVSYAQSPVVISQRPSEEDAEGRTKTKASPFCIHSDITVIKQGIKKKAERIGTKETFKTRVLDYIAEPSVKMNKAALHADEAKYSEELDLENKKDSAVISGTSKTTDDPDEENEPSKSLADKIIELLEDENIVDIKFSKPTASSKKE